MSPFYASCNDCGRQIPLGSKRGRCESCWKIYEREKSRARRAKYGTTTERGYGRRHRDLRAGYERQIQTGLIKCARCGRPIVPGEPWDLGHDDNDRRRYSGKRYGSGREQRRPRAQTAPREPVRACSSDAEAGGA